MLDRLLDKLLDKPRFRRHRKRVGGFWVHSKTFGWRKMRLTQFMMDFRLFLDDPRLYNYGKQIEIYDPIPKELRLR